MMRARHAMTLAALAVAGIFSHAGSGYANQVAPGTARLATVAEWNRLCNDGDSPEEGARCRHRIQRAVVNGRSLGTYEPVQTSDTSLLQSRSGVLFDPALNRGVERVLEDSGLRTIVRLDNGVRCEAYSAAPDLVGTPVRNRSYRHLVRTWLDVFTDAPSDIRSITHARQNGKATLRFEAVANPAGDQAQSIRGAYVFDADANAAIFSTCLLPRPSADSQQAAERFFDAILGSSRRFG
jgi:hypothetical protein